MWKMKLWILCDIKHTLYDFSPGFGGKHSLQWIPCRCLRGVSEARGICPQKGPANINRSEPAVLYAHNIILSRVFAVFFFKRS